MTIIPPEHDPLLQMMARAEPVIPESEVRERIAGAVAAERERCAQQVDSLAAQHDQMDMPGWAMELRKVAGLLRQGGEGGGT